MRNEIEQIDPAACPYRLRGENIAELSRGKLRVLARQLGVEPGESKLETFKQIVWHLQQSGALAELDGGR